MMSLRDVIYAFSNTKLTSLESFVLVKQYFVSNCTFIESYLCEILEITKKPVQRRCCTPSHTKYSHRSICNTGSYTIKFEIER